MPQEPPQLAALPHWWTRREVNFAEVQHVTQVPPDTLYSWFRLIRAMRDGFGEKRRGEWAFSAHELYQFGLITALYDLGIPIGVAQLNTVLDFAKEPHRPTDRLYTASRTGLAFTVIDAPGVFDVILNMMTRFMEVQGDA